MWPSRVYEIIRDAGKPIALDRSGLANKDEISAFTGSANWPESVASALGTRGMRGVPPKRTMTEPQAREFIRRPLGPRQLIFGPLLTGGTAIRPTGLDLSECESDREQVVADAGLPEPEVGVELLGGLIDSFGDQGACPQHAGTDARVA